MKHNLRKLNPYRLPRFNRGLTLNPQKGFTLIEILVAVAIVSLVSVLVIPNLRRTNEDQQLSNQAQDLLQVVRTAQSNSQSKVICPNGTNDPSANWTVQIRTSTVAGANWVYQILASCQDVANQATIYPNVLSGIAVTPPNTILLTSMSFPDDSGCSFSTISLDFNNFTNTSAFSDAANPCVNVQNDAHRVISVVFRNVRTNKDVTVLLARGGSGHVQ